MAQHRAKFASGLWASLPIVLGYFPIAFSFGVAATRGGLTAFEALAMSVIIYAGAAQFLALALLASGAPILISAFTLVAMNLRHVLYGPALLKRVGPDAARNWAAVWAFGLTDEVFGTVLGRLARDPKAYSEAFMMGVALASYAAWVLGTAAGAMAGGGALAGYPAIEAGLGFMLPALFLALLLSMLNSAQLPVIVVASLVTIAVTLLVTSTAGILAGMVAGAVFGTLQRGRR